MQNGNFKTIDSAPPVLCASLLDHALFYASLGIHVLPTSAGERWHGRPTKAPLTAHGYKDATTDEAQIRRWWTQLPGAMIGLALGDVSGGLVVIDLDVQKNFGPSSDEADDSTDPSVWKANFSGGYLALERAAEAGFAWPETSGCVATPSGGLHMYFRLANCPSKVSRQGADFQSNGSYVIAAPSQLADGRTYEFIGSSALGGLKVFFSKFGSIPRAPAWFRNPPVEYFPPKVHNRPKVHQPLVLHKPNGADTGFRALNDAALAKLDAWVRDLNLHKLRRMGPGYRAVAHWRPSSSGRPLERRDPNLSFHPTGIVDEGTGEGYTPINVVMSAFSYGQADMLNAAKWLAEHIDFDLDGALAAEAGPPIVLKTKADKAREREEGEEPEEEDAPLPVPILGDLEALCDPPGLVGEIVDWIVATVERPSRAVALGLALGFVATLAGRLFAAPNDMRSNLYIVTLAPSGYGKDRPRDAIKRLAQAAVLKNYLGAGRLMSTTALRNALMRQPTCLFMVDEFHGMMGMILDRRNNYGQLLGIDLMEVFANAATYFSGAEYANTPAVDIQNPNLSLYGTSTQDAFWASVNSTSALNGLLARMILFNIEGQKPVEVIPTVSVRDVPPELIAKCQAIARAGVGTLANRHDGTHGVGATVVGYGDGAEDRLREFKRMIELWEGRCDARQTPFLNRAAEHAIKVALTVAVGCDPANPVITREIMDWACRLSWHSTRSMIAETQGRIADGQREADYNRLLALIKAAGAEGLKPSAIPDRTRNMDAKRRDELLRDLQAAGRVRFGPMQTKRGTRERWIFVR